MVLYNSCPSGVSLRMGSRLKFSPQMAQLLGKQLVTALLKFVGTELCMQRGQRIETAVFRVLFQVIVGVHQINESAQPPAQTLEHRRPHVVGVLEHVAQQGTETAAQGVQILAAGTFQLAQGVQLRTDGAALARMRFLNGGQIPLQLPRIAQAGPVVLVLPVIEIIVVGKGDAHVRRVIDIPVGGPGPCLDGMGQTAAGGVAGFGLIEGTLQDGRKSQIKGQGHPPGACRSAFPVPRKDRSNSPGSNPGLILSGLSGKW